VLKVLKLAGRSFAQKSGWMMQRRGRKSPQHPAAAFEGVFLSTQLHNSAAI
jgi:hypothetical protein